jgi:hypothetical protein
LRIELNSIIQESTKKIDDQIIRGSEKHDLLFRKIEALLPSALTAGLSSAYSEKRTNEAKNYEGLKIQFNAGIIGLILTALIAFAISIYVIKTGTTFKQALYLLPNISVAIIPLYIPLLWFTFAANKRVNLSKRLIEEYTHKEVISKTFEGLSNQITNLDDSPSSQELRLKLLFNLLEMSTENPGKLISDYKDSDHPIVEVLKHRTKFEKALSRAREVPGANKIVELLEKRAEKTSEQIVKVMEKAAE